MKDIIKYKITIDDEYSEGEDLGIDMIAFTAKPAVITKGFAFNTELPKLKYFADELKYRICAPVMVPMDIYRCDSNEEYYVQFTVSEIDKIHSKFMKTISTRDIFNLDHVRDAIVPAYVLETWIVEDPATDKAFMSYGITVPKGTLMMTTQITDETVYHELVKSGRLGYSIEGFLGLSIPDIQQKMSEEPPFHENCKCTKVDGKIENEPGVCDYCLEQSQFNKEKQNKKQKMEKQTLPAGEYTSADGTIFIVDEAGNATPKEVTPVDEKLAIEDKEPKEIPCAEVPVEVPVEAPEPVAVIEAYTKEEVDAKFEEIYKMIADIKSEEITEDETAEVPVALNANQRFEQFVRFSNSTPNL